MALVPYADRTLATVPMLNFSSLEESSGELAPRAHDFAEARKGDFDTSSLEVLLSMAERLRDADVMVGGASGGDDGLVSLRARVTVSVTAAAPRGRQTPRAARRAAPRSSDAACDDGGARALATVRVDATSDALARERDERDAAARGSSMRRAPLVVLSLGDPLFARGLREFARQFDAAARAAGGDGALPELVVVCDRERADERAAFDAVRAALRGVRAAPEAPASDDAAAGVAAARASEPPAAIVAAARASQPLVASRFAALGDRIHLVDPERRVGCVPARASAGLTRQLLQRSATCGVRFLRRCAARPNTAALPLRVHRAVTAHPSASCSAEIGA